MLGDLSHSCELVVVTRSEIEKRQLIKLSLLLIRHFDGLVVTVRQCFRSKAAPELGSVQFLCHFNGNLEVTTFKRKLEPSLRILDELQSDLRVAFLLQVRDDALSDEAGSLDDLEHLVIIPLDQGKFEAVLSRINLQDSGLGCAVQAVDVAALDPNKVDSLVESTDNSIVAVQILVLK